MCSRYSRLSLVEAIMRQFGIERPKFALPPRYNIAPTDEAEVVIEEDHMRVLKRMTFGLVPSWAKDVQFGLHCLNARAETVAEKPAFRDAFRKRRGLVVADGFFEWLRDGKTKRPFRFLNKNGQPFGLAGLWDVWKSPEGNSLWTFAIITTEANDLLATIHDRMPVIIGPENYGKWLARDVTDPAALLPLLKPYPSEAMTSYEVSTYVSNSANKGPAGVAPLQVR